MNTYTIDEPAPTTPVSPKKLQKPFLLTSRIAEITMVIKIAIGNAL